VIKNHKILMEKAMKTLSGISFDMYKKPEPEARMAGDYGRRLKGACLDGRHKRLYPQEITGYYHSIHPVVVVVCVISTDQLRNLG
jgi:hypothetical protein